MESGAQRGYPTYPAPHSEQWPHPKLLPSLGSLREAGSLLDVPLVRGHGTGQSPKYLVPQAPLSGGQGTGTGIWQRVRGPQGPSEASFPRSAWL